MIYNKQRYKDLRIKFLIGKITYKEELEYNSLTDAINAEWKKRVRNNGN